MVKSEEFTEHFTGAVELANTFFFAGGDGSTNNLKQAISIFAKFGTIEQVAGCVVCKAGGKEAEADALEIAKKYFPKERWYDVCSVQTRESEVLREFEKDTESATERRADWIDRIIKSVEITIETFRSAQAQICVVYLGNGGHSVPTREAITQLQASGEIPHLLVVALKPENDKLAQPIFEENIKFLKENNLPYIIFESRTDENGTYTAQDYVNNLALFGILCEKKYLPEQKRSELDFMRLVSYTKCKCGIKIAKGHILKIEVGDNSLYVKSKSWWRKKIDFHRDVVIDSLRRSLKKVGICQQCLYSVVGDVNRYEVERAEKYLNTNLEYRFVRMEEKFKDIVIGKFEPC